MCTALEERNKDHSGSGLLSPAFHSGSADLTSPPGKAGGSGCPPTGGAGASFRRPGPAASGSLPPCPMGRDTRFDTTRMEAWQSGHMHMGWSHKLSSPTEPSVLASHPHPSLYTHREKWGCCGRAALVDVQTRSFRKDGPRGGLRAGRVSVLAGAASTGPLAPGRRGLGVGDVR